MKIWEAYLCASCNTVTESRDTCPSCTDSCLIPLSSFVKPITDERDIAIARIVERATL